MSEENNTAPDNESNRDASTEQDASTLKYSVTYVPGDIVDVSEVDPKVKKRIKRYCPDNSYITLLSTTLSDFYAKSARVETDVDTEITKSRIEAWSTSIQDGIGGVLMHAGQNATTREGSKWVNVVEHEGSKIGPKLPNVLGAKKSNPVGNVALQVMGAALNAGQSMTVPLWHSGFWMTITPPPLSERAQLDLNIARSANDLGRATRGEAFSNENAITLKEFMKLVTDNTIRVNVSDFDIDSLSEIVDVRDINLIATYFAQAIHTAGFNLKRPCSIDFTKCQHIKSEVINFNRILYTDESRFSKEQLDHLVNPNKMHTVDDLIKYRNGLRNINNTITVNDDMRIKLRPTTTVSELISAGNKWFNEISSITEIALTKDPDARESYISRQTLSTTLRKYAHYVDSIIINYGDDIVELNDRETMDTSLSQYSGDEELVTSFFTGIRKYMDSNLLSTPVVSNYQCPNCNGWQSDSHIVPLDGLSLFMETQSIAVKQALKMIRQQSETDGS